MAFFELAGPSSLSKFCCSNGATRDDNYSPEVVCQSSVEYHTSLLLSRVGYNYVIVIDYAKNGVIGAISFGMVSADTFKYIFFHA